MFTNSVHDPCQADRILAGVLNQINIPFNPIKLINKLAVVRNIFLLGIRKSKDCHTPPSGPPDGKTMRPPAPLTAVACCLHGGFHGLACLSLFIYLFPGLADWLEPLLRRASH